MVSGRDPGELGLYGFRRRVEASYELELVSARDVVAPRVWDVLGERGLRSSVLFVPPTSPVPVVRGEAVSCFLTPDDAPSYTYPSRLKGELEARFGPYVADVDDVRTADLGSLYEKLEQMTAQHFAIARHLWQTRDPDFMMLVEIGPDRFHHAFFQHLDPQHPQHQPGNPYAELGPRYYALLDREIASLVALCDAQTSVLIASDHGARALEGAFCINEWLIQRGLLTLREEARGLGPRPLQPSMVDWSRTRVWAEGGYYARVFFNVRGREPQGVLDPTELEAERAALQRALREVRGPRGEAWTNRIEAPRDLYREVQGRAPDLLAVFDDLAVRPIATVGSGVLYAEGDDRGADGCNHDWDGIFVMAGAGIEARGDLGTLDIQDVGKTVLGLFDVQAPPGFLGVDRSRMS